MAGNLLVWSDLTLAPSFKVKRVLPADKGSDIGVDSKPQPRVHKTSMAHKTIPEQGPQVSLPGSGDDPQEPVFQPVQSSVEPFATGLEPSTDLKQDSTGPTL